MTIEKKILNWWNETGFTLLNGNKPDFVKDAEASQGVYNGAFESPSKITEVEAYKMFTESNKI